APWVSSSTELLMAARVMPRMSTPLCSKNLRSSTEIIAHFIAGEISSELSGSRYCSYNVAILSPSSSSITLVRGGGLRASSADVVLTVSLALLDSTPSPPTTGNSNPATRMPASTQSPASFSMPSVLRMVVRILGPGGSSVTHSGGSWNHSGSGYVPAANEGNSNLGGERPGR